MRDLLSLPLQPNLTYHKIYNLIINDTNTVKFFSTKLVIWRLFHLSIVGPLILSGKPQFLCLKASEQFEKRTRQDKSLINMTKRVLPHRLIPVLFDRLKRQIDGSSTVGTQWLLFILADQEINALSTIFITRRCCWSVQKPCFGGVSIGVEKQTQVMVVRQNNLNTIMLKNVKLSYGNIRFHL